MATIDSVLTKIRNLISKSNSTTGRSDTDLTNAVDALIDGYGKGGGVTPSGSIELTENGKTYDVTDYASAKVNVPVPEQTIAVRTVVVDADVTGGSAVQKTLLTGDEFIKKHYADEGFCVVFRPVTQLEGGAYRAVGMCHGNRKLSVFSPSHGFLLMCNAAGTAVGYAGINGAINGTTYNLGFRVNSAGNLVIYLPANRNLGAGTYEIVMTTD